MNFYQQKYFQPYRKIHREPLPSPYRRSHSRSSSRERHFHESPARRNHESPARRGHESPARRGNYPQAPVFKRSPLKYLAQPRETTEPIWEHLYNEGKKSKQELLEKQNKTKNKIDTECTFQPILKPSKRYLVHSSSNFLDRVSLWNEQKIERKVKVKEDKVCSDLKECTFTPKMYPRMRTGTEYENRSPLKTEKSQKELRWTNRPNHLDCSPIRSSRKEVSRSPTPKQKRTSVEMPEAMRLIKQELRMMKL